MNKIYRVSLILLPILVLIFYGKVLTIEDNSFSNDFPPRIFPAFQLEDLEGNLVQSSNFNGITVLNIWASWCITCLVEHPFLSSLPKSDVELIGLNYKDSRLKATDWLKRHGNPYSFSIYDPRGDLAFDLGVTGAPETFLIFNQRVVGHIQGEVNEDKWQSIFLPLISRIQKEIN